jgi:hypothetical protein
MKVIAPYILALLFSFSVPTLGSEDESRIGNQQQIDFKPIVSSQSVSAEKQDELFTEIFVYLLIISVYALYWRNAS